ncbi:MAG: aminotransferase class V-fold PLP-dependent enzyme [Bacteroidetes bacterium]|nr:aminotransferase class V-fold PLP-dependent enzyme [Rhodothermia bacterium]MCS7156001.1 aminotransferase class V-fold PLP-dependent enzyme [Bacteroidota bacterium]MCX7907689.1 aminotransferase class V-fold PLP-dependent enzyme [Bacteroidota bacterium]MDW8137818.1 aminotransferase class V-fold PLP-dependent enzyme [Bacteroidota bacterium]MDW8286331.1 aminotransferase class V-fold PLP-dependent enzyme [Bacteroidota bacterium]
MRLETLAVHAGLHPDPTTGAVVPPIYLSTTFERAPDGSFPHGYIYSRLNNPNRVQLEEALAQLEGGSIAAVFSSGMAAIMAVFQALQAGDHVVVPQDVYHGTAKLLRGLFVDWKLAVTFADVWDPDALRAALRPNTRLVWVETPSNPLLRITDIAETVRIAHQIGARVACDNTWATPVLQRPLEFGVDLVVHATTKYIGGHSDVTGGAVIAREADAFFERIRFIQIQGGAVPSPFDCWLLLRGIRTLPYRVRAHSANALAVARFLCAHPRVEAVFYPGLESHPGHEVAKRQMAGGFGGMVAFLVRGSAEEALAVAARTRLFIRATSLGGVESLIEHRASIEGPGTRAPENLLRLSVGIEHPEDLIADLEQALSGV